MTARSIAYQLEAFSDLLHIADGFPMPVCHFKRAHGSRVYAGEADYGYCASKGETYYEFKGNMMINSEGVITQITAAAAHIIASWRETAQRL